MRVKYGSYSHALNECRVVISKDVLRGEGMKPIEMRERWDVAGQLHADTVAALTIALDRLEASYSHDGYDIGLYTDTGGSTAHAMRSSQTIRGTRVIQPPSYPEGSGAEYTTFRNYTLAVEGDYLAAESPLIAWRESINWRGTGGPRWTYQFPLVGIPQRQTLTQYSLVTVTQEGYAVGYNVYPSPASPLWPSQEQGEMRGGEMAFPELGSRERRISWSYTFHFYGLPVGYPTVR